MTVVAINHLTHTFQNPAKSLDSTHATAIYVDRIESADGVINVQHIYCTATPTPSHFNTYASIGDHLIDMSNGDEWVMSAAATWKKITSS